MANETFFLMGVLTLLPVWIFFKENCCILQCKWQFADEHVLSVPFKNFDNDLELDIDYNTFKILLKIFITIYTLDPLSFSFQGLPYS